MSRDTTIRFRCTAAEKARWEQDAAKVKMSLSEFLRWRANSAGQTVNVIASGPLDAESLLGLADSGVVGGLGAAAPGSAEPLPSKADTAAPSRTFTPDFKGV